MDGQEVGGKGERRDGWSGGGREGGKGVMGGQEVGGKGERRDGWSGGGREGGKKRWMVRRWEGRGKEEMDGQEVGGKGERMEGMAEEREETITCSISKVFLHKITHDFLEPVLHVLLPNALGRLPQQLVTVASQLPGREGKRECWRCD